MKNVFLYPILAIALLAFCSGPFATAQELTERERELLRTIEDLERRVTELERVVKGDDGAPATQEPAPVPPPAASAPPPRPNDLRVYWQEGIRLDSADGDFKLRIGGRTQWDHALFDLDESLRSALGDVENGVEFRRARLYLRGTIYENYEFKTQFDFAAGSARFRDVYVAMNNVPYVGRVKAGHFYEPMSLEQQTSDNYITFMERSLQEIFYPGRNVGVALSNTALDQRMTWAAGVFRDTDSIGAGANDAGGMAVTR